MTAVPQTQQGTYQHGTPETTALMGNHTGPGGGARLPHGSAVGECEGTFMSSFFSAYWADLIARIDGPLHFRFYIQPLMATLLAVRDGRRDALAGRGAYLWSLVTDPRATSLPGCKRLEKESCGFSRSPWFSTPSTSSCLAWPEAGAGTADSSSPGGGPIRAAARSGKPNLAIDRGPGSSQNAG